MLTVAFVWILMALFIMLVMTPLAYRVGFFHSRDDMPIILASSIVVPPIVMIMLLAVIACEVYRSMTVTLYGNACDLIKNVSGVESW